MPKWSPCVLASTHLWHHHRLRTQFLCRYFTSTTTNLTQTHLLDRYIKGALLWNGNRTARLLFWIPDPVFMQSWLVNPTSSRARDQAIILARLAAVLTATRNWWSLRLRDRNAACVDGVCHDTWWIARSCVLVGQRPRGRELIYAAIILQRVNARARPRPQAFLILNT